MTGEMEDLLLSELGIVLWQVLGLSFNEDFGNLRNYEKVKSYLRYPG